MSLAGCTSLPSDSFLWPELRNGLGPPDLVEDVLLLLEGVGLGEVDLNLAQHFHSGPVVEHDIDLSRICRAASESVESYYNKGCTSAAERKKEKRETSAWER